MLVLATDLDGAFLGGSIQERNALYGLIRSLREELVLIFVTGRGVQNVRSLLVDPALPVPDYIIADVGATVRHGRTYESVEPLDTRLAERWQGSEPVLRTITSVSGLQRQTQAQERRCSFYTEDPKTVEVVRTAVVSLGYGVIYSAGRYLDVVAADVSKGTTLKCLIDQLGIDSERILVAGDSLNDLSMFTETNYRGVVVGGSELALRESTSARERTYHAARNGAGGILEAMALFALIPNARPSILRDAADLVIAYHRQPFDEICVNGEVQHRTCGTPNGIIPTLLGLFRSGRKGAWLAWSSAEGAQRHPRVKLADTNFHNLTLVRMFLTPHEIDSFYHKLAKDALWPVLHSFIERATFNHLDWQYFTAVNERFARLAALEAAQGALVWIHDYNLWLVPKFLRQMRPDLQLAYFHHTPFPAADIFNVIPWNREIVASLLNCNYIGFHIPRYRENFVDTAASHFPLRIRSAECNDPRFQARGGALCTARATTQVEVDGHHVAIGVHPVGVDLARVRSCMQSEEFHECLHRLAGMFAGRKVILSAERLDYMKGMPQKLQAFERFLAMTPEWREERISLICICTPPPEGMVAYEKVRHEVEHLVGKINGQFSTPTWTPITFMVRQEPFERLAAFFSIADIAWVTPLRDGLNLVAKEYVAVRGHLGRSGVLILSEFAGCSVELDGALIVNPYDITQMADTLRHALEMHSDEQRDRMLRLDSVVQSRDVEWWARDFLRCATRDARLSYPERYDHARFADTLDATRD